MKSARLIVAALAFSLVAAACSSGYDRDSAFEDLTTNPQFAFTDEEANCILDEVEAQDLEDVVVEDDIEDVDPADIAAVTDIFAQCALGDVLTDELDDAVQEELGAETG